MGVGSILTDRFNDDSDVDFAINFDEETIKSEKLDYTDLFFNFLNGLKEIVGRQVDIVFDDCVQNPYLRKELDATKKLIYG